MYFMQSFGANFYTHGEALSNVTLHHIKRSQIDLATLLPSLHPVRVSALCRWEYQQAWIPSSWQTWHPKSTTISTWTHSISWKTRSPPLPALSAILSVRELIRVCYYCHGCYSHFNLVKGLIGSFSKHYAPVFLLQFSVPPAWTWSW